MLTWRKNAHSRYAPQPCHLSIHQNIFFQTDCYHGALRETSWLWVFSSLWFITTFWFTLTVFMFVRCGQGHFVKWFGLGLRYTLNITFSCNAYICFDLKAMKATQHNARRIFFLFLSNQSELRITKAILNQSQNILLSPRGGLQYR